MLYVLPPTVSSKIDVQYSRLDNTRPGKGPFRLGSGRRQIQDKTYVSQAKRLPDHFAIPLCDLIPQISHQQFPNAIFTPSRMNDRTRSLGTLITMDKGADISGEVSR